MAICDTRFLVPRISSQFIVGIDHILYFIVIFLCPLLSSQGFFVWSLLPLPLSFLLFFILFPFPLSISSSFFPTLSSILCCTSYLTNWIVFSPWIFLVIPPLEYPFFFFLSSNILHVPSVFPFILLYCFLGIFQVFFSFPGIWFCCKPLPSY